jgi:hypothetical protein
MPKLPTGYVNPAAYLYAPRPTICAVEGCGRPVGTGDYCHGHYARWRRTGDPGPAAVRPYRRRSAP